MLRAFEDCKYMKICNQTTFIYEENSELVSMLLNDVGTLLITVQFQMSLYDSNGCHPVYPVPPTIPNLHQTCWGGGVNIMIHVSPTLKQ